MGPMIEPERFPTLLAALLMFGLTLWILWLGPGRRLHRALALLVFLRALPLFVLAFDDRVDSAAGHFVAYLLIGIPFAAISFAYAFRMEHGPASVWTQRPASTRIRWAILILAVVFELLFLVRHDLWGAVDVTGLFRPGWMFLFTTFSYLTFAAVALSMALAVRHMPVGEQRRAVGLMAVAFAVEPLYRASFSLGSLGRVPTWSLFATAESASWAVTALLALLAMGLVWNPSRKTQAHRYRTLAGALAGTAVLSGLLVRTAFWEIAPTSIGDALLLLWTLDALWFTAFAALAAYATLMHHLFDIDLKAKALLNGGTFAAAVGFVLVVLGESLERVIPMSNEVLAILFAVAITLLLRPAQGLARRLADAAFPGVERSDDYVHRRRVQVYRAALEGAYRDGDITDRERDVLDTLRHEVGLDRGSADRLERDVRSRWTADVEGHHAPTRVPPDGGLPKPP